MARKRKRGRPRKRRDEEESPLGFEMNEDTKRGITVVLLFAVAALMFLSFFGIAGSLGTFVNSLLSQFFGFDRFLVPLVFILIGATLSYPDRGTFSNYNYLGILFFFLSFNALLNLFLVNRADPLTTDLSAAGGHLGQFLATLLPNFVGYWGAVVIVIALLVVAIMLTFNTSLRHLAGVHGHMTGWFGALLHLGGRRKDKQEGDEEWEDLDEEEEEDGDEGQGAGDEEEEEEDGDEGQGAGDEEEEEHEFNARPVSTPAAAESVLATKQRRQISIPLKFLHRSTSKAKAGDIERNKEIIEQTFREFGMEVEMGKTSVGPSVTQYTMRPSQGVKLSRILSLQNDLALALAAHPLRLEAPIPGKSLVGIEVPNTKVATVTLRDVLESKGYKERTSPLSIPLGKAVSGDTMCIALDKMPHILVAGATGSGKSACLNTMIVSWLYQNGPDDLKLIMVDPKRVELTAYAGIPHLLVPPITNVDDTINALKWTVREMERRLDMLSKFGARNIDQYNKKVEERMPRLVVVIDELADLMSTNSREVESAIVRIAQMARAVGIHLVLATQRPSVDVITGLIKANIPGRIAFAVASQTDSRTILDQGGAEKLLGRGDMLFSSAELAKPRRLQGAYVSSEEIEEIVRFLRKKGSPDYNLAVTEITKAGTVFNDLEDSDELLEDAIHIVLEADKASTSFLQRRLRVGYARAARIMDLMEQLGVIGEGRGAKAREILVDQWPPGGNVSEGMPTAQDDYNEAYTDKKDGDEGQGARGDDEEEEVGEDEEGELEEGEEEDGEEVDEGWYEDEKEEEEEKE